MSIWHEEGNYNAEIIDAQLTQAQSGNAQVELSLKPNFLYGSNPTEQLTVRPSRFPPRIFLTLTEATMGTAAEPGWVAQTLAFLGCTNIDQVQALVGWSGTVQCVYQDNNKKAGEQRENWSIVRPYEKRQSASPDKKAIRTLNTKFGKVLQSLAGKAPAQPAAQPVIPNGQAEAPPSGDEIPF